MKLADTYFYLLENPPERAFGLCADEICHQTDSFDPGIYAAARGRSFGSRSEAYADWLGDGRKQGLAYAPGKTTLLKIVLKAKDEPELIDKWIAHHAAIVGHENIIIADCGSTDPGYLKRLEHYASKLLVISYPRYYDYLHNVHANPAFFRLLARNCLYLTILDADEFLFGWDGGALSTESVADVLRPGTLEVIPGTWINNLCSFGTADGRIDWAQPIGLDLGLESLKQGTTAGKAVVRSDHLFAVQHLGHNLHVKDVVRHIRTSAFGKLFVLHLRNLHPGVARRRILKHLKAKGLVPSALDDLGEVTALLQKRLGEAPPIAADARRYAIEFLAMNMANANPVDATSRLLHEEVTREQLPLLAQRLGELDFAELLRSRATLLGLE